MLWMIRVTVIDVANKEFYPLFRTKWEADEYYKAATALAATRQIVVEEPIEIDIFTDVNSAITRTIGYVL